MYPYFKKYSLFTESGTITSYNTEFSMERFTIYFDCKYKFGAKVIDGNNKKEAIEKAPELIKNRAWCENRCNQCKLKVSLK